MRSILLLNTQFVLWTVLVSTPTVAWSAATVTLEETVDAIAKDAVESGSAVGLSIAIAKGDTTLLAKGYGLGDVEHAVPATKETVYRIGSITKQFTAVGILLLMQDGEITLDEPITRFLPEYRTQGHTVTIRHLLHHTSGIKSFTNLWSYRTELRNDVSHEDVFGRFQDLPFNFTPGDQFRYCNSGYYLLGVILEKVSKKSYRVFLKERVFQTVGLNHTCYDTHAQIIPNRASGYARIGKELQNAGYVSMTQPFSAGALASTVEDLITWQRALVNHKLLSADSLKMMTTPGKLNDGKPTSYGLGVFVRRLDGRVAIRHGGGIKGFRSALAYFPDTDHTIAALANCESSRPEKVLDKVARHLFAGEDN
jgi:CubicO group peptidase (beta-lactamase class C family)